MKLKETLENYLSTRLKDEDYDPKNRVFVAVRYESLTQEDEARYIVNTFPVGFSTLYALTRDIQGDIERTSPSLVSLVSFKVSLAIFRFSDLSGLNYKTILDYHVTEGASND